MTDTLITNAVTIIIALLAGIVALHQVKLNVVSDARIKWIESLRDALSQYCTELHKCSLLKANFFDEKAGKTGQELDNVLCKFYPPYSESSNEVLRLQSKVLLYLDSHDEQQKKIEDLLLENSLLLHDKNEYNIEFIRRNIEQIIRLAKEVFGAELKKSKRLFKI